MHYLTMKDEKKRQRVQVFEKNRLILKTIARTQNLPKKITVESTIETKSTKKRWFFYSY